MSIALPLGRVFKVKSSKSPRVPPLLPTQGVVGHTIDRCIKASKPLVHEVWLKKECVPKPLYRLKMGGGGGGGGGSVKKC